MPRYYCDYCDTYLTHDSPSVRKQHNSGYKHKANVRTYYQQFEELQTQSLIDQRIKEHLGQAAVFQHQIGSTFHQHLATLPGQIPPPRLPILPIPFSPISGSFNPQPLPSIRPPILPRPPHAYGAAPILPHGTTPPGATSFPPQPNGPLMPPPVNFPAAAGMPAALSEASQRPVPGASGAPGPTAALAPDGFTFSERPDVNQQV